VLLLRLPESDSVVPWTRRAAFAFNRTLPLPIIQTSLLLETRHHSIRMTSRAPGLRRLQYSKASTSLNSSSARTGHPPLRPFRYFDKGNLAVVGTNFAVLQSAGVQLSGFMAWLVWALIHIQFLADNSLRFTVFMQ
jgi:hypothetical protein